MRPGWSSPVLFVLLNGVIGLFVLLDAVVGNEVEFDGQMILSIDHSLDDGASWEHRGTVSIHSTRTGSSSLEQIPLRTEQKQELKDICEKQGLYLLRVSGQASQTDLGVHRTYGSACNVISANLIDSLTLHFDWRGKLSAVSYATNHQEKVQLSNPQILQNWLHMGEDINPGKEGKNDEAIEMVQKSMNFKTKVVTQHMVNGPAPDTAAFIQRVEQEKVDKQKGTTTDNRSFLAKYWMYIVPIVIFMAINGASEGANGGGGGR